jgi:hypothetical protein
MVEREFSVEPREFRIIAHHDVLAKRAELDLRSQLGCLELLRAEIRGRLHPYRFSRISSRALAGYADWFTELEGLELPYVIIIGFGW